MIAGDLPNSIGVIEGQTWISTPNGARPATQADVDAYAQQQAAGVAKTNAFYASNPNAFAKLTPEQAARVKELSLGHSASELTDYYGSINPTHLQNIHGNGVYSNGEDLWWGPQRGPQHTDNGSPFSLESLLTGGALLPYGEAAQDAFNNTKSGLAVMFGGPALGAAGTALAGAAAGAGAAGGGTAAGAGATGIDASTGLFAGESAASGSAGAGAYGGGVSAGGSNMLVADAGGTMTDVAPGLTGGNSSMPAAVPEADPMGGYNIDPNTGDVYYGSGDNPYASNFSGGTGNEGFSGYQPGVLEQAQAQATSLAKQFGLSPAAALQMALKGIGRAAPAALGAVGAKQQQNSLEALANKYLDFGAPSRARYEASYAPGFTMANDPGYMDALNQSSKATLHGLSVNGNPAGSPNAWAQSLSDNYAKTAYPALQNFRNTNANAGGIASLQTSAPGFDTSAVNAGKGVFDAIGGGINDIFNPKPSLAQTLADYRRMLGTAA